MLEPLVSMAFAIHSSPGVYAVLLGSGVSRSAAIPTGWEVVLDLVRRLVVAIGESCEPDPEEWYMDKFGERPQYDKLLKALAQTPSERQMLLQSYFEPSDEDVESSAKQPTAAHRAIASLVKSGHVKVVITTNFDRLTERALETAGITPTTISTPEGVVGAIPLVHARCVVLKVHGDYMDVRIRNTPEELAKYDRRINRLLDGILDEFGLIICGWSAEWDVALRAAIERCKSRRFTTYWAMRGAMSKTAERLVAQRAATVVQIGDADAFFTELVHRVEALASFASPHPLSAKMAVATMKRLLSKSEHRIELHDLVVRDTEKVCRTTADEHLPVSGSVPYTPEEVRKRLGIYESAMEVLLHLLATGCYWGTQEHDRLWTRVVERLGRLPATGGVVKWIELRAYPAALAFYAGGIAAVAGSRMSALRAIWGARVRVDSEGDLPAIQRLYGQGVMDPSTGHRMLLNREREATPFHNHLFAVLREPLRDVLPSDEDYDRAFDRFEYLIALAYLNDWAPETGEPRWLPVGRFGWKGRPFGAPEVFGEVDREVEALGAEWPPIAAGLLRSVEAYKRAATAVAKATTSRGWR